MLILAFLSTTTGKSVIRFHLLFIHDNGTLWLPLLDLESDRSKYFYLTIISEEGGLHITYT